MLHRAIVSSRQRNADLVVFFETASAAPDLALHNALTVLWDMPSTDIDSYNRVAEHELLRNWSFGPESDGDLRLFEIGGGPQGISYADPRQTLFLVRPKTLARLVAAQRLLPERAWRQAA